MELFKEEILLFVHEREIRDLIERKMEPFKEEILESINRKIGARRDFSERQMEILQGMRCMSQGQQEGFESMRREMQGLCQIIHQQFSEMSEHNWRKQQDNVALMAEIRRSGGYVQQSPSTRTSSDQQCINTFRLQFENLCRDTKYSKDQIRADDGTPLKVAIYDCDNKIIRYEPFSSMRVRIVAIDGDFDNDQKGVWTEDHFHSKIVHGRPNHEKLLSGTLYFKLQNGVGYLNDAKFQDSCCFVPSKMLKLAVMADDRRVMERIQEGITESFRVLDGRGRSAKKNLNPSPGDPVYKLKLIAMNGDRRKSLETSGIKTVEDFLCAYSKDDKKLRKIFWKISDHDWNIIVEQAHKCTPKRNNSHKHRPIFRNRDSSYLPGSCSGQPSHTVQPSFHEQIDAQVMHQQVSSTYNRLSFGVPPENLPSEFCQQQPNTSWQHGMVHEHIGAIQVTNQQISSTATGNEFQSVNNLQSSTSLEPDSLNCNIENDGSKLPSRSSAENILSGGTSLQANPPKRRRMSHDAPPHRVSVTSACRQHRRLKIVTNVAATVIVWKKGAARAARTRTTFASNDPVNPGIQSPLDDSIDSWSFLSRLDVSPPLNFSEL